MSLQPLQLTIGEVNGFMGPMLLGPGPTGEGATRPLKAVGRDAERKRHQVVLKLRNPSTAHGHYGATSLACELVFSILARYHGLPVPDYAIATIPSELIRHLSTERIRTALSPNTGANFATIYHQGFAPFVTTKAQANLLDTLKDVFCFDATVLNGDRQAANPNLLWDGNQLLCIDHGMAGPFGSNQNVATLPVSSLKSHVARNPLSKDVPAKLTSLHGMWTESVTQKFLTQVRQWIPKDWENQKGDLDSMFEFLKDRVRLFGEISSGMRMALA